MRFRPRHAGRALIGAALVASSLLVPGSAGANAVGSPPGPPMLLTPDAGATFGQGEAQLFSVTATDPDGHPYSGLITVRNAVGANVRTFTTHVSPSGVKSSGVPTPVLTEGSYTWSAQAVDATGAVGAASGSRSFRVEGPSAAGGGTVQGTTSYGGDGLSHGACGPAAFTMALTSADAVVNLAVVAYVGPLNITVTGSSACDSTSFGGGAATLYASGTGPSGSTLTCRGSVGTYTRRGPAMTVDSRGSCTLNSFAAADLRFVVTVAAAATTAGGGVTKPTTSEAVGGVFAVASS